eukprot:scaffold412131_cov18-Prasinocladus_malaysianus.AAC.1
MNGYGFSYGKAHVLQAGNQKGPMSVSLSQDEYGENQYEFGSSASKLSIIVPRSLLLTTRYRTGTEFLNTSLVALLLLAQLVPEM